MNELICGECGQAVPAGVSTCPNCGNPIAGSGGTDESSVKYCGKCGAKMEQQQQFCPNCGAKSGTQKKVNILIPIIVAIVAIIAGVLLVALKPPKVDSINVSQTSVELKGGETFQATYTIAPEKAAKKTEAQWASNNEAIATVSETGLITAVADGTAQITVTAKDKSASISVTVKTGPDFAAVSKKLGSGYWLEVADDGSYMSIDTNPFDEDDYYISGALKGVEKANKELGLPDSVYQKMLSTTSLQGRQEHTANGVKVSWTYHPDHGLEVMYEKAED